MAGKRQREIALLSTTSVLWLIIRPRDSFRLSAVKAPNVPGRPSGNDRSNKNIEENGLPGGSNNKHREVPDELLGVFTSVR
jgi:hypothetical protein